MNRFVLALAALSLGSTVTAQSSQPRMTSTCPNGICFALNVPDTTASSGQGDIYFQIKAPTSYSWVALAQGSEMSNANMFVMYQSADGTNVTVSARQAPGEVMPQHVTTTQIVVIEGSGVQNGQMIANVRCSNCQSWKDQTMNFRSGSSSWVYAYKSGSPIRSDSLTQMISKHDDHGDITFDTAAAIGGANANPFIAAAATTGSSSGNAGTGSATGNVNSGASSSGSSSSSSSSGGGESMSTMVRLTQAHGSLAALAFVGFFPIGAILVRWGSFSNIAWVHGAIQAFAYVVFIAGAGIGIYVAREIDYLDRPHIIIGLVLLSVVFFLPFFGVLHHSNFKKTGQRSLVSHGHIWVGRAVILLGMINGGLGVQYVGIQRWQIVYGVFAGIMGTLFVLSFVGGEAKRASGRKNSVKNGGGPGSDSDRHETKQEGA